jgi:hypothetical protein
MSLPLRPALPLLPSSAPFGKGANLPEARTYSQSPGPRFRRPRPSTAVGLGVPHDESICAETIRISGEDSP